MTAIFHLLFIIQEDICNSALVDDRVQELEKHWPQHQYQREVQYLKKRHKYETNCWLAGYYDSVDSLLCRFCEMFIMCSIGEIYHQSDDNVV